MSQCSRAASLVVLGLLAACGGEKPTAPPPPPPVPRPVRLEVFASESTLVAPRTIQLQLAAWDSLGRPLSQVRVRWRSQNPQWLSVDTLGWLAVSDTAPQGAYRMTATANNGGASDTLDLWVVHGGDLKWRLPIGRAATVGGPAQGPDGTIYAMGEAGEPDSEVVTLFAVSERGEILWKRRLPQADGSNYTVAGPDGTVYVVGQYVYAFSAEGSLRWSITTRPAEPIPNFPDFHSCALSGDGVLYAAMGYDLLALRATDGDTLWVGPRAADVSWLLPPTVSADRRTLYAKRTGKAQYALDAATGVARWSVRDPHPWGEPSFGAGPTLLGSRLLVPSIAWLQEMDTGGQVAGLSPDLGYGISEAIVGPDGTFYIQNPQNTGLVAFRDVGAPLWGKEGLRSVLPEHGGPALAEGGILYLASMWGFYSLRLGPTGATVGWRYPTMNSNEIVSFYGAPLIGRDGTVYTWTSCNPSEPGPCNGELFAFWEDKPVEANSPWPMWRHDPRRTGQAGPQPGASSRR